MPNGMDPNMQQNFFKGMNGIDGNMVAAQMNGGMRPPSSHPAQPFNGQMNPQMMARQPGGPQQMQWPGPNGNGMAPQGPQGPQGPQAQVQVTPQQRAMPPPSAPAPPANGNGRTNTSSPQTTTAAPPTPQQSTKAAPKKKDTKGAKSKVYHYCEVWINQKDANMMLRLRLKRARHQRLVPHPLLRLTKIRSLQRQPLLLLLATREQQLSNLARTLGLCNQPQMYQLLRRRLHLRQ